MKTSRTNETTATQRSSARRLSTLWRVPLFIVAALLGVSLVIPWLPVYAGVAAEPEPTAIFDNTPVTAATPLVQPTSERGAWDELDEEEEDSLPYKETLPDEELYPTPTAQAGERLDPCEPRNDAPERACVLPLNAVSGPFSFVPEGDVDLYSVDLGAQPFGLPIVVTVRGTSGLDLVTTIARGGSNEPLALIESPAISTTLAADLSGWVVLRVETRAAYPSVGETYRVEVRQTLPPPSLPDVRQPDDPRAEPDALENNWSPEHAAPIAVGAVYDLTLVCPERRADACPGGDHDYLALPVKRGMGYLLATFDLAAGVDTVVELFWPNADAQYQLIGGNDDYRPGRALLSALRWSAPADGTLLIRVGPRDGGTEARIPASSDNTPLRGYRFSAALADSDLAAQIAERLDEQTGWEPTPTPSATAVAEPAPPVRDDPPPPVVDEPVKPIATAEPDVADGETDPARAPNRTTTREGTAYIAIEAAELRVRPDPAAEVLQTLAGDTLVLLTGTAAGGWVEIETEDGVLPGWIRARDLRRLPNGAAATPTAGPVAPSDDGAEPTPAANGGPSTLPLVVTAIEPPPPPAAPPTLQRVPLSVKVRVVTGDVSEAQGSPQKAAAYPPLAGVRVQLVSAFGDVLTDALTDANGEVTLAVTVLPGTATRVRLPGIGVAAAVEERNTTITIVVPEPAAAQEGRR